MQLKAVGWSTDAISCRVKSSQVSREEREKIITTESAVVGYYLFEQTPQFSC